MAITLSHLLALFSSAQNSAEKIDCYHCGEKMRKNKSIYVKFNGKDQPVCCHGCLAILRTVEQNNMISEYLKAKSVQTET